MPFKPPPQQPDFSTLFTSLSNSKLHTTNNALYQTIFFLIQNTVQSTTLTAAEIETINDDISKIYAASILTVNNETINFPNSRQLLPGTNVTFDDTVEGKRTINATGGGSGGGLGNHYDCPLSDGDLEEADLIFASGECIIVQVPLP